MSHSDEELMSRYCNGEEEAFEILYRRYEKPILSFIYRMLMNAADAEDLCQETFFRVVRGKKKYQVTGKFKIWLFRIAHNLCRDRLRRMKFRSNLSLNNPISNQYSEHNELNKSVSDLSPDPLKHMETDEIRAKVQKAIASLPDEQRIVIILKEYYELKFTEIADILNSPTGTVKSLNYRGHEKLKKVLMKYID